MAELDQLMEKYLNTKADYNVLDAEAVKAEQEAKRLAKLRESAKDSLSSIVAELNAPEISVSDREIISVYEANKHNPVIYAALQEAYSGALAREEKRCIMWLAERNVVKLFHNNKK